MGSEQSQLGRDQQKRQNDLNAKRLMRGNTVAVSERRLSSPNGESCSNSRPVSPPISVCSDSDLPYVSYTDKPIGDSPKIRNKITAGPSRSSRSAGVSRRTVLPKAKSFAHDIVVVREANKKANEEIDVDLQRLQRIPQFLPVMRGAVNTPINCDADISKRIDEDHMKNMCNRMEEHLNKNATEVANHQAVLTAKIKEVDFEATKVFNSFTEKQKLYASFAEQLLKLQYVTQQLSRCNILLNQNIESLETLNNVLDPDDRLSPFIWKIPDDKEL